jgi:predicted nucleic acid-binding protein
MEHPVAAVLDANILYPAPLRDLFIRLAQAGLVEAKWSEKIHDEWIRSVLADNPRLSRERLERTRTLMNDAVRDCLVEGYEGLIPGLTLPDPDDRHVLAAAVHAGASVIVTFNLKDFPPEALHPFRVETQHPDDFIARLLDVAPAAVCTAARRQRVNLKNPPKTVEDYLATLAQLSLPQTVVRLQAFAELI